jgi:purine-binding chemotaxis protein CheW
VISSAVAGEAIAEDVTRACLVRIAGEVFGFAVEWTRGVVMVEKITPVPRSRARLLGVASVQGRVTPIFDAGSVLGLVTAPRRPPMTVLVLTAGEVRLGVAVDEVLALESFAAVTASSHGERVASGLASVRLPWRGDTVGLLDVPAVIRMLSDTDAKDGLAGTDVANP